jgi:ferredoxin
MPLRPTPLRTATVPPRLKRPTASNNNANNNTANNSTANSTGETTMKVTVDFDSCASTGACMQVCPEVFEVRNDGYLYILQENPGPELAAKVNEAADMCPTAAITVE